MECSSPSLRPERNQYRSLTYKLVFLITLKLISFLILITNQERSFAYAKFAHVAGTYTDESNTDQRDSLTDLNL